MSNPTIKEMVRAKLLEGGFDGLYNDECGCKLDDFMPCMEISELCQAGYLHPASEGSEYDYLICNSKEGPDGHD